MTWGVLVFVCLMSLYSHIWRNVILEINNRCPVFCCFFFYLLKFFSFVFISWRLITLQYCSGFCHTLTRISHGFACVPHPGPPPTSLSTRSLWVFPVHQARALVSCIQPGLVICFTLSSFKILWLPNQSLSLPPCLPSLLICSPQVSCHIVVSSPRKRILWQGSEDGLWPILRDQFSNPQGTNFHVSEYRSESSPNQALSWHLDHIFMKHPEPEDPDKPCLNSWLTNYEIICLLS